jgi:hypothetical protein
MQRTTEQAPRPGAQPERLFLSLRLRNGQAWSISFSSELEKCIGRYARIPEFAQAGHLLNIHGPEGLTSAA